MPRALRFGCDGIARCAASLDAALDVRAQHLSPLGCLRPINLGLLWIAKLDAACLGGGQGMACALADHVSLGLGSGGEHVKRQPVGPRHVGNGEIEAQLPGKSGGCLC
jgi:hypothetical protein